MQYTCTIAGDGGNKLAISVHGYENGDAEDPDDANWLTCEVRFDIAGFHGDWMANFTTYDFAKFLDEVDSISSQMKGKATFKTHEQVLEMEFLLKANGDLRICGKLQRSMGEPRGILDFSFGSDQSYLQIYAQELGTIVRQYPVVRK